MFCEKCGNPVNDNDKFCQKCGAPVNPLNAAPQQVAAAPQPEVQPVEVPAAPQPEVQPVEAPAAPQPEQAPTAYQPIPQQYDQPEQAPAYAQEFTQANIAPGQNAEKKPFPKAAKLGIIFGGAGVALVAVILVVIFAVIMPLTRPKIDLSKFVSVDLYQYGEQVVDGKISGEFRLDGDKIAEAYPQLFNSKPESRSALDSALYDIKVDYVDSNDSSNMNYGYKYVTFNDFKQDSEAKITIVVPEKDSFGAISLKTYEDRIGASFTGGTVNVKIADTIEANNYKVVSPVEIDLLGYLDSKKLVSTYIDYSGDVKIGVKPFEEKFGDFTVKNDSYESYAPAVYGSDGSYLTGIYLKFDKETGFKAGDKVTVNYESDKSYLADDYGIILTGSPFTYTVVIPEKLDDKTAKKYADGIKKYILDHPELDESCKTGDKLEVGDMYYVSWKDNSDYHDIVVVLHNATQNYYCTLELEAKGYFLDGEFVYGGYSGYTSSHEKTADDAVKNNSYLDSKSKYYTATKLN